MNPNLVIITLLLISVFTEAYPSNFEDTFGVAATAEFSSLADQVVDTRFDESAMTLQQKLNRLKNLQLRIKPKLEQHKDDPFIWFLHGLNQNNLADVVYLMALEKSGQQEASMNIEVSNYNIARSRAYSNAIRLDSTLPYRLSSTIYATMGYGLSNRQKVKTYSRELELGSPAENESDEWFMHWAKIDALVHEKNIDEAEKALQELEHLLRNRNKSDSAYSAIVDQARTQVKAEIETVESRKLSPIAKRSASIEEIGEQDKAWGWGGWLLIAAGAFTFIYMLTVAFNLRKA